MGFARSGVVQRQFKLPQPYDQVRCYTLLGNHRAAIGTNMGSYLVDVNTGLVQHELMDRGGEVLGMAPTTDWRYLLTAGNDQVLNVWQIESGELLLSFFPAGGDWIAWTPQGYYAASLAGETLMGWHMRPRADGQLLLAAQFHKSMYCPDVIRRLVEMGNVYRAVELADKAREVASRRLVIADVLPPKVRVTEPGESSVETEDSQLEVRATAEPAEGHPLAQLRLIVDGRPRGAAQLAAADAPTEPMQGQWQVDLPPGKHSIVVKAETADSYAFEPAGRSDPKRGRAGRRPIVRAGDRRRLASVRHAAIQHAVVQYAAIQHAGVGCGVERRGFGRCGQRPGRCQSVRGGRQLAVRRSDRSCIGRPASHGGGHRRAMGQAA